MAPHKLGMGVCVGKYEHIEGVWVGAFANLLRHVQVIDKTSVYFITAYYSIAVSLNID
jgi:hypothetical protein